MGQWTKTAPTLPSGAQWLQGKTISGTSNHWNMTGTIHIASLSSTQFAVRMEMTSLNGSYGTYYAPGYWDLECNGEETKSFSVAKGTQTFYYIGEASAGTEITTSFLTGESAIDPKSVVQAVPTGVETQQFWTKASPTLPEGSDWEQTKTFVGSSNNWVFEGSVSIARLEGNKFAIKAILKSGPGPTGNYYQPSRWYFRCDIGGVEGSVDTSYGISEGTVTYYFISEASFGTTISATFNGFGGAGSAIADKTVSFVASSSSSSGYGGMIWADISGNKKKVSAMWVNINGAWKKASALG